MHTPGPYVAIDDLSTMDAIGIYADNGGTLIAELRDPEGAADARQMQANAAFIVRAMNTHAELLEALKGLFEHCAMTHKHWGEGSNAKDADAAIQSAQRLIANAEGRA